MKKIYWIVSSKYRKLKPLKDHIILKKTLAFSIIYSKWSNEDKKIFKKEESIKIVKLLRLTINIEV